MKYYLLVLSISIQVQMSFFITSIVYDGESYGINAIHKDHNSMYLTIEHSQVGDVIVNVRDICFGCDTTLNMYSHSVQDCKYKISHVCSVYRSDIRLSCIKDSWFTTNHDGYRHHLVKLSKHGHLICNGRRVYVNNMFFVIVRAITCNIRAIAYKYPSGNIIWTDIKEHFILCTLIDHIILDIQKLIQLYCLLLLNDKLNLPFKIFL